MSMKYHRLQLLLVIVVIVIVDGQYQNQYSGATGCGTCSSYYYGNTGYNNYYGYYPYYPNYYSYGQSAGAYSNYPSYYGANRQIIDAVSGGGDAYPASLPSGTSQVSAGGGETIIDEGDVGSAVANRRSIPVIDRETMVDEGDIDDSDYEVVEGEVTDAAIAIDTKIDQEQHNSSLAHVDATAIDVQTSEHKSIEEHHDGSAESIDYGDTELKSIGKIGVATELDEEKDGVAL